MLFHPDTTKTIALDRQRDLIRAADKWRLARAAKASGTGKVRAGKHGLHTRFSPLQRGETA
jgi:hypothetical protein